METISQEFAAEQEPEAETPTRWERFWPIAEEWGVHPIAASGGMAALTLTMALEPTAESFFLMTELIGLAVLLPAYLLQRFEFDLEEDRRRAITKAILVGLSVSGPLLGLCLMTVLGLMGGARPPPPPGAGAGRHRRHRSEQPGGPRRGPSARPALPFSNHSPKEHSHEQRQRHLVQPASLRRGAPEGGAFWPGTKSRPAFQASATSRRALWPSKSMRPARISSPASCWGRAIRPRSTARSRRGSASPIKTREWIAKGGAP